jgi:hypothetical protein
MNVLRFVLFLALVQTLGSAQPAPSEQPDQVMSKEFLQQLIEDHVYFFIAPKVAESLLTHRIEPIIPNGEMLPRVSGTVIVALEITKD